MTDDELSVAESTAAGTSSESEQEIPASRQEYFRSCYEDTPDSIRGTYPLAGVRLTRSDVEWLLSNAKSLRNGSEIIIRPPPTIELHQPGAGLSLRFLAPTDPADDEREHEYSWLESNPHRVGSLDLRGADLSGQDLAGLDFSDACAGLWETIPGSSLNWVHENIEAAAVSFAGSHISGCRFDRAVLVGANFDGAIGESVSFRCADLRYSMLRAGMLPKSDFAWANLGRASLAGLRADSAQFSRATLAGVHAGQGYFHRARFEGAEFCHSKNGYVTEFTPAEFPGADLTDARLEGAILGDELGGVDLSRAVFGSAVFSGATLRGADLSGTDLTRCALSGSDLRETSMGGAVLGSYRKDCAAILLGSKLPEDKVPIEEDIRYMSEGDFQAARPKVPPAVERVRRWIPDYPETLQGADLRGAFLDAGTRLEGVKLSSETDGVCIEGVHWGDCDVSVIDWAGVARLGDELAADGAIVKRDYEPKSAEVTYQEDGDDPVAQQAAKARRRRELKVRLLESAMRANRQVAALLRTNGIEEESDLFTYRAKQLQRQVFWVRGARRRYLGSALQAGISGYGYRPARALGLYLFVIMAFATLYWRADPTDLTAARALILSAISFHGRGFFSTSLLHAPILLGFGAALESLVGLLVEAVLIATVAQRFLSK